MDANAELTALAARAAAADGQPPFSDQSLVELRDGRRELVLLPGVGPDVAAAVLRRGAPALPASALPSPTLPAEAELVVDPAHRAAGLGGRLLAALLADNSGLVLWAHGNHPAARALAERHGMPVTRHLLQLRAAVPAEPTPLEPGFAAFRPGTDDAEWLALNARAFAHHPEQGSLGQADLNARLAEPWFSADDFLLLRDADDGLLAFCWLKVADGIGEFYAVGVDPAAQGTGLGRRLVAAGLARLAARGIRTSSLYVEADNLPAVRLYRSYGFADHTVDVQYTAPIN